MKSLLDSLKRCALVAVFCLAASAEAELQPLALRCEFGEDPAGVDIPQPRLCWQVASSQKGHRQAAYQILAATSLHVLSENRGDLWDSGRVESAETTHITYTGKPLKSSQAVFWKLKVWDESGKESRWSKPASWIMGLLSPEEWHAKWICASAATEALLLRKEFTVKPGLVRTIAHVSGLGHYEMFLNGGKVGADLLTPGWTDYDATVLYDTRDVTQELKPGRNAIGIALGNGMYNVVRRNRFAKFTGSFGPLRAIVHLRLEYAGGSVETIGTDETWRTHSGPVTYNSIYGGEDYDARLNPVGWTTPGFPDRDWKDAVAVVRPAGSLHGFTGSVEPIRAIETRTPVATREIQPGSLYVYDLGQNVSCMPRVTVSGPKGSTVRLVPAEVVNADGNIQRSTMGSINRGISWWEYTKATDGTETWFPQFYYVGCRYLEARLQAPHAGGAPPKLDRLEGVVVHSSAAPVGEFECSDPMLNRIRDLVRWAQRANMVSVLTDCPHREKLGWIEQFHLNGPAIRYEFDMARMFTKAMSDMAEAQLDTGLVPNIAPEYTEFKGAFRGAAEWGAAFLLVPWQQYEFYGDRQLLDRHYPAMKRYLAYLKSRAVDGLLEDGLGDWFDVGAAKSGKAQQTPPAYTASAFLYYDTMTMVRIAEVLGKTPDQAEFQARAAKLRSGFNKRFFDELKGTYGTGSQTANAIALAMGFVEPQHQTNVLASLVNDVASRGFATTAGDVGFRFVLRALADNGRSDVVYRMARQEEKPGYGYMLKKGATSLTESWDANLTTSHNHFMLGQITEWFYHDLAGIRPAGPGFKKITIAPQPVGDLAWVRASYDSIRGPIKSEWKRNGSELVLKLSIPANTTATVRVPGRLVDSGSARVLGENSTCAELEIGSGDWEFRSRL